MDTETLDRARDVAAELLPAFRGAGRVCVRQPLVAEYLQSSVGDVQRFAHAIAGQVEPSEAAEEGRHLLPAGD